ncbi:MAG TPA: DUF3263 domain-containing protein [Stackebrandtia sp.]|jgi:hypothetical protein|uniref:DUF3263 domain-containing protein n=1 Tax=Stackebrandtia sp. TaxID=2023065 RepID=UPI002D311017|nr:DUF3263 domain-containing protein [Stackebrandtia sp.]HZE41130.1 DUF3263 domain-containing protein [Stackebrandtia sp.]
MDSPPDRLTRTQRAVLDIERRWWRGAGAKQRAIKDELDVSVTRYYQLLSELLDNPDALAVEPTLINRLRRARDARRRARTAH